MTERKTLKLFYWFYLKLSSIGNPILLLYSNPISSITNDGIASWPHLLCFRIQQDYKH